MKRCGQGYESRGTGRGASRKVWGKRASVHALARPRVFTSLGALLIRSLWVFMEALLYSHDWLISHWPLADSASSPSPFPCSQEVRRSSSPCNPRLGSPGNQHSLPPTSFGYLRASQKSSINITKDTSRALITGNLKGFRSRKPETLEEDQIHKNIFWSFEWPKINFL